MNCKQIAVIHRISSYLSHQLKMVWAKTIFLYITDIYFADHSSAPFESAARSAAPLVPIYHSYLFVWANFPILDILLTVHLSIIYSLFPTWYTAFLFTYNTCYPLSSTCFRPHRPIIRRSKLYMQPMVLSPSADVFVVRPLRKNSFSTTARQRHLQRGRVP